MKHTFIISFAASILFAVGCQAVFDQYKDWKTTSEHMELCNENAIYMHCLPADRGHEVNNDVMDKTEGPGWRSAIFDQAENRLHAQKAVMSLFM